MSRPSYLLSSFLIGLLFGIGLLLSGLANPGKVLAFLDVAGRWDPSLMLVMGAAILTAAPFFALARRRPASLSGEPLHLPGPRPVDRRLVTGSLAFGIGWGLVGFCPGPAVVAVGLLDFRAVTFVVAMVAGMGLFEAWERHLQAGGTTEEG
ncbi:MAG: DUF6691 family protein [Rhodoferax sp.]